MNGADCKMFDLILKNGTVIDGNLTPRFKADVGISGDKIAAVGDLQTASAKTILDVTGKIVSPGFIDVHGHSDGWLRRGEPLLPKTSQGFTTELLMLDGIGYAPVNAHTAREWLFYLRALNGLRVDEYAGWERIQEYTALIQERSVQNFMCHVPYANVRTLAMGFGSGAPNDFQMQTIQTLILDGMADGAVGVSTGLDYIAQCFATTTELAEACSAIPNAMYATHVRYKKGTLNGVKEAVEIGRRAKVAVHISHLKGSTEADTEALLNYIDTIATQEVEFSFDIYPYTPSSTMLNYLLPLEIWEEGALAAVAKLNNPAIQYRFGLRLAKMRLDEMVIAWTATKDGQRHIGKTLAEYVTEVGNPAADALCDLLIEERLAVLLVFRPTSYDERLFEPFLKHPNAILATDGIYFPDGQIHPRMYGSSTKFLASNLVSLEEAVCKLSGYPAEKFGVKNRGVVQEGCYADLVVFDENAIKDKATFKQPHQISEGMETVIVNGTPIILDGQLNPNLTSPYPGRYLKYKS